VSLTVGEGVDQAGLRTGLIWNAQWKRAFGTAAQYVIARRASGSIPNNVDLPLRDIRRSGTTAWCRHIEGDVAGKPIRCRWCGCCHFAIQIAKAKGATVIVNGRSESVAVSCSSGGSRLYSQPSHCVERVKEITNGKGVDFIDVDIAANASILPDIIATAWNGCGYGTSASDVTYPYGLLLIVFPSGSSSFMNFNLTGSNFRSDQSFAD